MSKSILLILAVLLSLISIPSLSAQDTTITVATIPFYPPFESMDEEGELVGFDVDIMEAIAEDAGFEVEWVNAPPQGLLQALAAGDYDVVIAALTILPEREELIDFTYPYFSAGLALILSEDTASKFEDMENLEGVRVGVEVGTSAAQLAADLDGVEVVSFNGIRQALQMLYEGEIDAVINDGAATAYLIAENPEWDTLFVGDVLAEELYGIAVDPAQRDLLEPLRESLLNVMTDGTYTEIYVEWFGQDPPEVIAEGTYYEIHIGQDPPADEETEEASDGS